MRPVSAEFETNQDFAAMPTAGVVGNRNASNTTVAYWVALYGNYQPYGHAGMDILCPVGTPVHAIADGTVLWADWGWKLPGDDSWGPSGYFRRWALYKMFPGIVTVIQHKGWIGVYAHLSDNNAAPKGTVVKEGQLIGKSGASSGYSANGVGAHLHVEALVDLSFKTGNGLIYGRTDPTKFFGSGIAAQGTIKTPAKEWYEMALDQNTKNEIHAAVWGPADASEKGAPFIYNNALKRPEYPRTVLGAMQDRIVNQQLAPLRQAVASQDAQIKGLIGAVAAMAKGEPFDQAKLLAGVQSAAAAGVAEAITSIDTTITLKAG